VSRVSDSELRDIIEAREGEKLTQYTDDAALLVNETLGTDSGLSEDRLKLIEKNLAAHLWVISAEKGGLQSERTLEAENVYQKIEGQGLSSTRFGRLVQTYDTTGQLDKVLTPVKKAQLRVV
jgi:hypothetical protein